MRLTSLLCAGACALIASGSVFAQEAPTGSPATPDAKQQKLLNDFKGKLSGKIVWSSSRSNSKHDIWIMNADGTDQKQLTKGDYVDWFSRFSPDGSKVMFARSKFGWVNEMDAEMFDKWDIWMINTDGSDEKKVVENACWGTWRPTGDSIVFARGPKVFIKCLSDGNETEIFDAGQTIKKGAYSQQPQMSPDGKFLAITIRGTDRQTGIFNRQTKVWNGTGGGCQINWYPSSREVVRMNEGHGNGGTEVLHIKIDDNGKPLIKIAGLAVPKELKLMDLPGRRSHEYFPMIDKSGQWMVWCATQYGHEHDIVDYEVFIWKMGTGPKTPVQLTFHTGNDRWPDIHLD
jgi:hypothetical protein